MNTLLTQINLLVETVNIGIFPINLFSFLLDDQKLQAVWPDWGKFHHFGKIFQVLGNILWVYLLFGKISDLFWQILYAIGQVFIDVNGQMLKNNLAIWSHWLQAYL